MNGPISLLWRQRGGSLWHGLSCDRNRKWLRASKQWWPQRVMATVSVSELNHISSLKGCSRLLTGFGKSSVQHKALMSQVSEIFHLVCQFIYFYHLICLWGSKCFVSCITKSLPEKCVSFSYCWNLEAALCWLCPNQRLEQNPVWCSLKSLL